MSSDVNDRINDPLEEIARLEDRLDAVSGMLARMESANEERIPLEIVERLSSGESPLRVWRDHRRLTAEALATRARVPLATVVAIEAGRVEGPLGVFIALAKSLSIDAEDLLPWPQEGDARP